MGLLQVRLKVVNGLAVSVAHHSCHGFLRGQWISVDFSRPLERSFDVRTDVLPSHMLLKFRLMHELCGLLTCSTEQQGTA